MNDKNLTEKTDENESSLEDQEEILKRRISGNPMIYLHLMGD